jgi:hypothetical protein
VFRRGSEYFARKLGEYGGVEGRDRKLDGVATHRRPAFVIRDTPVLPSVEHADRPTAFRASAKPENKYGESLSRRRRGRSATPKRARTAVSRASARAPRVLGHDP